MCLQDLVVIVHKLGKKHFALEMEGFNSKKSAEFHPRFPFGKQVGTQKPQIFRSSH